jgi:sulfur carrier protein
MMIYVRKEVIAIPPSPIRRLMPYPCKKMEDMKILFPDGELKEIEASGETVEETLHRLGLNPLEFLVSHEGEIIPEDTGTAGLDTIRLIRISHGG